MTSSSEGARRDDAAPDLTATVSASSSKVEADCLAEDRVQQLSVTVLIGTEVNHPGAGAVVVQDAFSSTTLKRMDALRASLPLNTLRPTALRRLVTYADQPLRNGAVLGD